MLQVGNTVHRAVWKPDVSMQALLAPDYDWIFVDSLLVDQLEISMIQQYAGTTSRWAVLYTISRSSIHTTRHPILLLMLRRCAHMICLSLQVRIPGNA